MFGNYDASATIDNGSCQAVLGCMDETACNYDACADLNYGCDYLDACGICDGQERFMIAAVRTFRRETAIAMEIS